MGTLSDEDALFSADDAQMLDHIVDVIGDRMRNEDGYTEDNEATLTRLERLRDACRTEGLVCVVAVTVTAEMITQDDSDDDAYECRDRDGNAHPEHDYGTADCRRCGAEAAE